MGSHELRMLELWAPRSSVGRWRGKGPTQVHSVLPDTKVTRHTVLLVSGSGGISSSCSQSPIRGAVGPFGNSHSSSPCSPGSDVPLPHYFWKFAIMVAIWKKKPQQGKKSDHCQVPSRKNYVAFFSEPQLVILNSHRRCVINAVQQILVLASRSSSLGSW